tara:strand:+ start:9681 stop:10073 length:393 start_codon:yes stop_codon:yes gene_type:complete
VKIFDKNQKLVAEIVKLEDIQSERHFYTYDDQDFQLASFSFKENTEVARHIHNKQERKINSTSEVIVLIQGGLDVDIYDDNKNLIKNLILEEGDTIIFYSGGHGIKANKDSKFIEVKQGPYNPLTDKELF